MSLPINSPKNHNKNSPKHSNYMARMMIVSSKDFAQRANGKVAHKSWQTLLFIGTRNETSFLLNEFCLLSHSLSARTTVSDACMSVECSNVVYFAMRYLIAAASHASMLSKVSENTKKNKSLESNFSSQKTSQTTFIGSRPIGLVVVVAVL